MRHGILGTGMVGRALGDTLIAEGHEVRLGSRQGRSDDGDAWAAAGGPDAGQGTFAEVADWAEIVWLAVKGEHAVAVLTSAADGVEDKVVLDLTNPLDFSRGFPPRLFVCNDDSLGEQLQRAVPRARLVKTLNTLSNALMLHPGKLPAPTHVFVAGDDDDAKVAAASILTSFGHQPPIDLGGIDASRGLEAWLLLWTRLYGALGDAMFNVAIVRER